MTTESHDNSRADKPVALGSTDGLGPLPTAGERSPTDCSPLFSADQMRSYAAAAVAAERERIASLLERHLGLAGALVADHVRDDDWPNVL